MKSVWKEIAIFTIIFIVLSLGIHMDKWLTSPMAHFKQLHSHVMPWHPFIYTFLGYFVLGVIRALLLLIKSIFIKLNA